MIDAIMTTTTSVFALGMIPQIIKSYKDKEVCLAWWTLITTTLGMYVFVGCFIYLKLPLNVFANVVLSLMWTSLIAMKIFYRRG